MKGPHLLRVEEGPEAFGALIAAARELGLRVGWLELAPPQSEILEPAPAGLAAAAAQGVLRAVSAGGGRTLALKPLRGEPVLRDLLREHFQGCALVLVRGEVPASRLAVAGEVFRVALLEGAERDYTAADLAAALRRPRLTRRDTSYPA